VLVVGLLLLVVGLRDRTLGPVVPFLSIPVVALGVAEWFLWPMLFPRGLKATAMDVTYMASLGTRKMQRSDINLVFRGQAIEPSRGGGSWVRSYSFAKADGNVGFSCPAAWFADDGMAEFARRLGVPVRGDFSVRVKNRLDPTTS
jgi:hypothetical protein